MSANSNNILSRPLEQLSGQIGLSGEPCCGVVALAVIANMPYQETFDYMRRNIVKKPFWRGETYPSDRSRFLHAMLIGYLTVFDDKNNHRMSFKNWRYAYVKPATTYLICIPHHAFVYRDGYMIDQGCKAGFMDVRKSWVSLKRLVLAWEILDNEQDAIAS